MNSVAVHAAVRPVIPRDEVVGPDNRHPVRAVRRVLAAERDRNVSIRIRFGVEGVVRLNIASPNIRRVQRQTGFVGIACHGPEQINPRFVRNGQHEWPLPVEKVTLRVDRCVLVVGVVGRKPEMPQQRTRRAYDVAATRWTIDPVEHTSRAGDLAGLQICEDMLKGRLVDFGRVSFCGLCDQVGGLRIPGGMLHRPADDGLRILRIRQVDVLPSAVYPGLTPDAVG